MSPKIAERVSGSAISNQVSRTQDLFNSLSLSLSFGGCDGRDHRHRRQQLRAQLRHDDDNDDDEEPPHEETLRTLSSSDDESDSDDTVAGDAGTHPQQNAASS